MTLSELNSCSVDQFKEELFRCCSSKRFVNELTVLRPFKTQIDLEEKASTIWNSLKKEDWLEAFSHHPQIGGDLNKLKEKFQSTKSWSKGEQSGVEEATENTLKELSEYNLEYQKKFGFVFLICATGKTADEMLQFLKERINNTMEQELQNASIEQEKIIKIRINKLLGV